VIWGAVAGGIVGTVVLTTLLRAASELGLTRMDIPFLLGTAFTGDRVRAKAIGYAAHFASGVVFAAVYGFLFDTVGTSSWWLGAVFGLFHGLFAGTVVVNVLLPVVHPRMGSEITSAPSVALLERPGFLLLNYGIRTPIVTLVAHVAYGAIVGAFASLG
jgi:hypothetical protein